MLGKGREGRPREYHRRWWEQESMDLEDSGGSGEAEEVKSDTEGEMERGTEAVHCGRGKISPNILKG